MFKTVQQAFEYLVRQYQQNTGKFPIGKQIEDLMRQANQMISKSTLTLTDEVKPTFSTVDERKLPKAQIEALPLADKEKATQALQKKMEAQKTQAIQSLKGGESSGGQRGIPELVDENFGQTLYIDSSEMLQIMDDAQRKFDQASDAVAQGNYDLARNILRYDIEDNFKLPQATRDAAYDARVFIRRGEGLAKDMGYDNEEEILEALNDKIAEGVQTTYQDNWPLYTAPDDASNMKSIEYVDFLDEAGEDFGTPNSQIITPGDMGYEYAEGGRVGFNEGGPASAKDFIESTGDSELMAIYIKVLDGTLPEDALTKLLEKKGYKTYATGGRVGLAGGASLKYMIDFILKNARKVTKKVPSKQFLEKMAEMNPQNIVNAYEDVKKRAGIIDDPDVLMGQAPKTDLEKIKSKVKKDKEGIQQLADDNQIPVRDDTGPKTKTIKKIITAEELKTLGKKEGISEQDVEKFLSGESSLLKRGQARGVVQRDKEGNIIIKDKYSKKYDPLRETPVFKDETITIPEPFAGKFKDEFMAHDNLFGKRSGDNKIDAELIAEQVAEMKGLDYDDLPYKEQLDLYDKAYNYLGLLDRTKSAMKEAKGRTLQASGGLAYLMGL